MISKELTGKKHRQGKTGNSRPARQTGIRSFKRQGRTLVDTKKVQRNVPGLEKKQRGTNRANQFGDLVQSRTQESQMHAIRGGRDTNGAGRNPTQTNAPIQTRRHFLLMRQTCKMGYCGKKSEKCYNLNIFTRFAILDPQGYNKIEDTKFPDQLKKLIKANLWTVHRDRWRQVSN